MKLKDLLLDLDLGDYDISLTGFEQNDLTELVDKLAIEPEAVDDDFNEDEALERAEAEPVTKLGDVWLLGRHRLMCGDSTSQDDMAVLMNGEIADLVVTDPPYNVNYGDKAEMLDEYLPPKDTATSITSRTIIWTTRVSIRSYWQPTRVPMNL